MEASNGTADTRQGRIDSDDIVSNLGHKKGLDAVRAGGAGMQVTLNPATSAFSRTQQLQSAWNDKEANLAAYGAVANAATGEGQVRRSSDSIGHLPLASDGVRLGGDNANVDATGGYVRVLKPLSTYDPLSGMDVNIARNSSMRREALSSTSPDSVGDNPVDDRQPSSNFNSKGPSELFARHLDDEDDTPPTSRNLAMNSNIHPSYRNHTFGKTASSKFSKEYLAIYAKSKKVKKSEERSDDIRSGQSYSANLEGRGVVLDDEGTLTSLITAGSSVRNQGSRSDMQQHLQPATLSNGRTLSSILVTGTTTGLAPLPNGQLDLKYNSAKSDSPNLKDGQVEGSYGRKHGLAEDDLSYQKQDQAVKSTLSSHGSLLQGSSTSKGDDSLADPNVNRFSFPMKLHDMLARKEYSNILSWLPNGTAWIVIDPKKLEKVVLRKYFRHGKFTSFSRQVNGWGFARITSGREKNAYYHELFLRDNPRQCMLMKRNYACSKSCSSSVSAHSRMHHTGVLNDKRRLGVDLSKEALSSMLSNSNDLHLQPAQSHQVNNFSIRNNTRESHIGATLGTNTLLPSVASTSIPALPSNAALLQELRQYQVQNAIAQAQIGQLSNVTPAANLDEMLQNLNAVNNATYLQSLIQKNAVDNALLTGNGLNLLPSQNTGIESLLYQQLQNQSQQQHQLNPLDVVGLGALNSSAMGQGGVGSLSRKDFDAYEQLRLNFHGALQQGGTAINGQLSNPNSQSSCLAALLSGNATGVNSNLRNLQNPLSLGGSSQDNKVVAPPSVPCDSLSIPQHQVGNSPAASGSCENGGGTGGDNSLYGLLNGFR